MTVVEKQNQIVEDFGVIENRQERLAAIVDRARHQPPLPAAARTGENRVAGCISSVWILAELREGRLHFRHDADSPLVRGLVALLCDLYEGGTPEEIVRVEPALLEALDLLRDLTPTRRNGLAAVRARLKALAATAAAASF
jgi:cysteine desulfuration protein SufE